MLTDEEREKVRADAETGILATIRSCTDDAQAIADAIGANDVPLDVIARSLDALEDAAGQIRQVRDEYDMSIRADAHEAIARMGGGEGESEE